MEALFFRMLIVSAAVSVVLLPLLALLPRWRRRYAARTRKTLWLAVVLVLLIAPLLPRTWAPVRLEAPQTDVVLHAAGTKSPAGVVPAVPQGETDPGTPGQTASGGAAVNVMTETPEASVRTVSWTALLAALWLAGGAAALLGHLAFYLLARRRLLAKARPAAGYDGMAEEICPRRRVRFLRAPGLDTPMTMGILRPAVLLPETGAAPAAVRHELIHIRRWDVAYKAVLLLACAVHWFNPLVWLMARRAGRDVEASCDAAVVAGGDADELREYGALLIQSAAGREVPFTTCFGGGKGQVKARLYELFHPGKRSRVLVMAVLVICLIASSLVAWGNSDQSGQKGISEERAFDLLEESITYEDGVLSFTVPDMDFPSQTWRIYVAGRAEFSDGMSMSLHYFNENEWRPGETYRETIGEVAPALTGLDMNLFLGGHERSVDLLPYLGGGAAAPAPLTGAVKQEGISEEEAFDLLEESITYEDGVLSFTVPDMDFPSQTWRIYVAGRAEYPDGMSMDVHYFNESEWRPGETYRETIGETAPALTELNMDLSLGEHERSVDLLPCLGGGAAAPAQQLGTTEAFVSFGGFEAEVTHVREVKQETVMTDGGEPGECTVFVCYPGAAVTILNAGMSDPAFNEDGQPHPQFGFLWNRGDTEDTLRITDDTEPVEVTSDLKCIYSLESGDGVLKFELADLAGAG